MAEITTIARPYAAAAFQHARQVGQLDAWSDMLGFLAAVYQDPGMRAALSNPALTKTDVEGLLLRVCEDRLDAVGRNLLILLARNARLPALPSIHALYEEHKAEEQSVVDARVETAFALSDEQLQQLVTRLEKRTQRRVRPAVSLNPTLIGGVRVTMGDQVWDASVRGRLDGLTAGLMG